MYKTTFNNISVIWWRSVLLVDETGEHHCLWDASVRSTNNTILTRPSRYNWNIVESGVKHHTTIPYRRCLLTMEIENIIWIWKSMSVRQKFIIYWVMYRTTCIINRPYIRGHSIHNNIWKEGNTTAFWGVGVCGYFFLLLLLNLFSCLHVTSELQDIPEAYIHLIHAFLLKEK